MRPLRGLISGVCDWKAIDAEMAQVGLVYGGGRGGVASGDSPVGVGACGVDGWIRNFHVWGFVGGSFGPHLALFLHVTQTFSNITNWFGGGTVMGSTCLSTNRESLSFAGKIMLT